MGEANYSKLSCDMAPLENDEAVERGPPGGFCIDTLAGGQRVMYHKLPEGSYGVLYLRPIVDKTRQAHPSWQWDADTKRPTLSPSVHLPGRWHGWIRQGRMESR